jgi:formylglycine-generating enzyme required for sulfatase activity
MGSPTTEPGRFSTETQHQVTLTSGFYMGKYEVTQAQYEAVMRKTIVEQQALATNPLTNNDGQGNNYPMYYVSWYDAIMFCNKLSILEGLSPAYRISGSTNPATWGDVPASSNATWNDVQIVTGSNGYRLPTEAQWEYSCRAGTAEGFNWGTDYSNSTQANYNGASYRTVMVGSYAPNAWGLYDMHGNVSEWCWDWYDTNYGSEAGLAVTDPMGASSGSANRYTVIRGGDWLEVGSYMRSAKRRYSSPQQRSRFTGFRVIRPGTGI